VTDRGLVAWRPPVGADPSALRLLSSKLGVSNLMARILHARGLGDPGRAARFLDPRLSDLPKPTAMAGIELAVDRLVRAVERRERIAVYGDYDADGLTSTAVALLSLRTLGLDVEPWLANRFEHGYGVAPAGVDEMARDGRTLLLALDCGTTDHEALARARDLGLDVVVVDHHAPSGGLPPALAVINPFQERCEFPDKGLASVGLTFYLMAALKTRLSASLDLHELLDLVAVGTVADVAPLVGANRILVHRGLARINSRPRPGLAALCGLSDQPSRASAATIGFQLGPRINAAGRLGHAGPALDLLLAASDSEASPLARTLDELSQRRRAIQDHVADEAEAEAREQVARGHAAIVVSGAGWHQGVIGIVASRLCEQHWRPAAVVSVEGSQGKASARAPAGIDLHEALQECSRFLDRFGGHAGAAGFSLAVADLDAFHSALDRAVERQLGGASLGREICTDAEVVESELHLATAAEIAKLEPFGEANPEPVLLVRGLRPVTVREVRGGHISGVLELGRTQVKVFGPNMGGTWPAGADRIDVLCFLRRDAFRGDERVELRLLDVKA
jgi:single-stranded-DNA-specific exonuclease